MDEKNLHSPALLNWYNIQPPQIGKNFQTNKHWLIQLDNHLILNGIPLNIQQGALIGAIEYQDIIITASKNEIMLLTAQGELIEHLSKMHGIPENIQRLGIKQEQLVVQTDHKTYLADDNFIEWQTIHDSKIEWATAEPLNVDQQRQLLQYSGEGVKLERVILDLHSGRILGNWGVYLMDLMAVLFLLLSLMGVWMWSWRKRHHKSPVASSNR